MVWNAKTGMKLDHVHIMIIIIINLFYILQFNINGILTALYIVIHYSHTHYMHIHMDMHMYLHIIHLYIFYNYHSAGRIPLVLNCAI